MFKPGQYVIYKDGSGSYEIGRIKSIVEDQDCAFVWYHGGETAAKTRFEDLRPISNSRCITKTILGGAANVD